MKNKLIFEKSTPGRTAYSLPECDVEKRDLEKLIPSKLLRTKPPELPEVSELELVRHFIELSHKNLAVDTTFYPLGSCTMKYNPKINDKCASLPNFTHIHPHQPIETVQGTLQVLYELEQFLCEIGGMDAVSLQPAAGAHGELTGLMVIKSYLKGKGEMNRREVLIPDSAHGTNPASSTLCGFKTIIVKSNKLGEVDIKDLKAKISNKTALMMITNPNTLGLFESNILDIANIIHENGALLYMDGANLNALLGITRPGDFGIDVLHFNLHKTFSTPHGGGGPGAGPIGVKEFLEPYLPIPCITKKDNLYKFDYDKPLSIGKVKSFYGNIGVIIMAYVYIRACGAEGLKKVAHNAVLNANYLLSRLKNIYTLPYGKTCMHEFVLSAAQQKKLGVRALDIAKRLLDYGFHPPTIYFPLIVSEALMIEPTETENKETLDEFANALIKISEEAKENPDLVKHAPYTMSVKRLDELKAAREPKLRWVQKPSE